MIRGANVLNLDVKGRMAIPSVYRQDLVERCEGKMTVTVNTTGEHCLWLYPRDEWMEVEKKVKQLPSFDPNHLKLNRFLIGLSNDVEMDKNGRILLVAPLREFAKLTKSICLVGQGNKFEIWDEELWNMRCEQWLKEGMDLSNISVEMEQLSL